MIPLLLRVLLFGALVYLVYFLFAKLIPKAVFTVTGMAVTVALMILAFFTNQLLPEFVGQFLIFPFKPLNLAIIFLVSATTKIFQTSEDRLLKFTMAGTCALLVLLSMPIVSESLVTFYEKLSTEVVTTELDPDSTQAQALDPNQKVRVIIVLGHQATRINLPEGSRIQLTDRGDRLAYAAQLYREQSPERPTMIISAGMRNDLDGEEKFRFETKELEEILVARNVPRNAIVPDPKSATIRASAKEIYKLLEDKELLEQPAFLVTSAINMGRAYLTFKELGINVISKPTDFYGYTKANDDLKPRLQPTDILPSIDALRVSSKVAEDFFGTVYYFMRGWLNLGLGFYFKS